MKKLLIDVNSIVPYYVSGKVNGIGRTTLELVTALDKIKDIPFEISLYSQNLKGIGGRNLNTSFKTHHLYAPNRTSWNRVLNRFPLRKWMSGYDLMHIPHNFDQIRNPESCIATIHDAMFFSYPESFLGHDFAKKNYPPFARRCKSIITCSQSSKKEISEYMNVDPDNIHVIPWGVDHDILKPRTRMVNRYCGELPFFFSVSCDIGRKNTISTIRAYEQFAKQSPSHHLILVWGNPPPSIRQIHQSSPAHDRIHFISNISNEELAQLYSDATATFFPSKYEGFGLPILESFATGTPVITCRNSSLTEVGGDAALYVEPEDIDTMAEIMAKFENKNYPYKVLQEQALAQASLFTWENAAQKTINVYQQCLN